jgi:NAD(P)-dependent dehydrogenase (short-subunit alcohol dehydrogenase family)
MKNLLIVGGSGALGKATLSTFKRSSNWKVFNIDFKANADADYNFTISNNLNSDELTSISTKIDSKLDCIINTAGGWEGSTISDSNIIESTTNMMKMNLNSSLLSAFLAKKHLNENSLLVFTGAATIKNQFCPFMLSYDLSKNAVHHLTDLLAGSNELPNNTKVITILPYIIF